MNRLLLFVPSLILTIAASAPADDGPTVPAGFAKVDVTPEGPVHIINQLEAREAVEVAQPLFARAIALGDDDRLAVLVSFDGIGVPAHVADEVAAKLKRATGIPRERVAICATHTHWAPHLSRLLPTIFAGPLPASHQQNVDQYTRMLTDRLIEAARKAIEARRPCRLSRAEGRVGFAANRRIEADGTVVTADNLMFTWNPNAPVDHSLPVLFAHDENGTLRGIVYTYACHNVALTLRDFVAFENRIHGDWFGLASERLEARHPDCVAIGTVGCGGDARPSPVGDLSVATAHAKTVADEIDRLLDRPDLQRRLDSAVTDASFVRTELPLEPLPGADVLRDYVEAGERPSRNLQARAYLAGAILKQRERGDRPSDHVPYSVQSWAIGDQLVIVFLAGEVVSDYALRIRREFDADRMWVMAYANATPCYIPSKRLLARGGYEAGSSMHYYGYVRPLQPATEDVVMRAVHEAVPMSFAESGQATDADPEP